jgi:phosphoribosyl-AMP cyclohydrolase
MKDVQKLIESITSNEIQRCVNSIAYNTVNKTIDFLKEKHGTFVKVENITVDSDDDGLVTIKIVMRKALC